MQYPLAVNPASPFEQRAADQALLDKINAAVATANEAEKTAETAKAELVSRLRAVGELLLEAKKRHSKVADFEAFLKRVDGLKLSRAYDAMRLCENFKCLPRLHFKSLRAQRTRKPNILRKLDKRT
jgi:hypothetical protein